MCIRDQYGRMPDALPEVLSLDAAPLDGGEHEIVWSLALGRLTEGRDDLLGERYGAPSPLRLRGAEIDAALALLPCLPDADDGLRAVEVEVGDGQGCGFAPAHPGADEGEDERLVVLSLIHI